MARWRVHACIYCIQAGLCVCMEGGWGGGEGEGKRRCRRDATQVWIRVKCPNLESKPACLDSERTGKAAIAAAVELVKTQIWWIKREFNINAKYRYPYLSVGSGRVGSREGGGRKLRQTADLGTPFPRDSRQVLFCFFFFPRFHRQNSGKHNNLAF